MAGTDAFEEGATRETQGETLDSPDSAQKFAYRPGPDIVVHVDAVRAALAAEVGVGMMPVAGSASVLPLGAWSSSHPRVGLLRIWLRHLAMGVVGV